MSAGAILAAGISSVVTGIAFVGIACFAKFAFRPLDRWMSRRHEERIKRKAREFDI